MIYLSIRRLTGDTANVFLAQEVPVARNQAELTAISNNRAEHMWRCDAHPTWSPSGHRLAVNAVNLQNGLRQVWIVEVPV